MNNSYITIIKEKRTALSRKRVPLNQNECTDDFRIGVPFEQNLQASGKNHLKGPRKRTAEDDERFRESFEKMIHMAMDKEK